MNLFTILLAGRMRPTDRLKAAVAGSRIVAADAGISHAAALGVAPELWVGDFDSAPPHPSIELTSVPRQRFSPDKDLTDGEIAIEAAIERGATGLLLVGALGGERSDHAFAHLILALRYAARGLDVELFDGIERGWPLAPTGVSRRFDLSAGGQFSILKFSKVSGLTIEGAKYPLADVELAFHSILTQSNEALGPVDVSLRSGDAILLAQETPGAH